ncbi:hypothetical protein EZS27_017197 [termite gut metagenome]|uniref:DUF5723 domain-containing protein n=1 Tax=termite gut metagenome TaxID=433724 RepID=A0A5J4RNM8_9ZZZZ
MKNMKPYIIKLVFPVFCVLFAVGMSAQDIRSAYFLKGTSLNHRMNPAFVSEYDYVSIPVLGNMYINTQANVGLSNFIYKYDNSQYGLTTFLNESVDGKSFLNKLHDNNKIDINLNTTILSAGFHAWGGFNTVELGLKSSVSLNLPYALFDFMKSGMKKEAGNTYKLKDLSARSNNYVELALGHARPIDDYLVVGAKVKGLIGIANLDVKFNDMSIAMDKDKWVIKADGTLDAAIKGGQFETETSDNGKEEITGFKLNSPGIGGIGLGLDLGASYRLADDLTLSAAILDLGFISWSNTLQGRTNGEKFTFEGFEDIKIIKDDAGSGGGSKGVKDQLDDIADDLEGMIKFYDAGKGSRTTSLATTVNLGAEYTSYLYDKLTFGLLSSTRFNGLYTWTEARLSANVAPLKWFEASLSGGVSNFGTSLGGVLNFHPKSINFFIGADCLFTQVTPQFVPVNRPNLRANFGFNITFENKIFSK